VNWNLESNFVSISDLFHTCYKYGPSHIPRFGRLNNKWCGRETGDYKIINSNTVFT